MPKFVLNTKINASHMINGIAFEDHPEGKVSCEAVDDEVAEFLSRIPGYKLLDRKFDGESFPATPSVDLPVQPPADPAASFPPVDDLVKDQTNPASGADEEQPKVDETTGGSAASEGNGSAAPEGEQKVVRRHGPRKGRRPSHF